jgi:hypothetical protein
MIGDRRPGRTKRIAAVDPKRSHDGDDAGRVVRPHAIPRR